MKKLAHALGIIALALSVSVALGAGGGFGGGGGGRGGRGGGFAGGGAGMQTDNTLGGAVVIPDSANGAGRGGTGITLNVDAYFYTNEYAILIQQIALDDPQKPKAKVQIDAMNAELQAFLQNNAIAQGTVTVAQMSLAAQIAKLADDYTAIALLHQIKIDAELTADQKLQWEAFKLHRVIDPRLTSVGLTDAQTATIKTLISDTARAIGALTDSTQIPNLTGRVYRKIVSDVLTEPQAAKLTTDTTTLPGGGRVLAAGGVGGGTVIGNVGGGALGAGNVAGAGGGFGPGGGAAGGFGGGFGGGRGGRGGRGGGGGGGGGFGGGAGGLGGGAGGGPGAGGGGPGGAAGGGGAGGMP